MARGTVIVEAPEKSGALITARFALDQDRDLWVDRIGVSSPLGKGIARLAEDGAAVLDSARDILAEWNLDSYIGKEKGKGKRGDAAHSAAKNTGAGLASSLAEYLNIKL